MKPRLMAHMVAGYPDAQGSFTVARALVDGGASCLEIQFPFSDPSADGPSIQNACSQSLEAGFRVESGFELVREIAIRYPHCPVFVMVYANIAYTRTMSGFLDELSSAGAEGVIIPDLPPGYDDGLYTLAADRGISAVPVITPYISPERLEEILTHHTEYVYVAIRKGITGIKTDISENLIIFLDALAARGIKVLAGFGVRSAEQVHTLGSYVYAVVVGSYLVDSITEQKERTGSVDYRELRETVGQLL